MDPSFIIPKVYFRSCFSTKWIQEEEVKRENGRSTVVVVFCDTQRGLWVKSKSGAQVSHCSSCVQVKVKVKVRDCVIAWGQGCVRGEIRTNRFYCSSICLNSNVRNPNLTQNIQLFGQSRSKSHAHLGDEKRF